MSTGTTNPADIRAQLAAEISAGNRYQVLLVDPPYPHRAGRRVPAPSSGRPHPGVRDASTLLGEVPG